MGSERDTAGGEAVELLPCPFCGDADLRHSLPVLCVCCGAQGPVALDADRFTMWNTRALLASADEARRVEEWRDISTAPVDHGEYLFATECGRQRVDGFHRSQGPSAKRRWREVPADPYTHWRDLPGLPAALQRSADDAR